MAFRRVVTVDGPELADLAELMTMQVTIHDGQQVVIVEFHTTQARARFPLRDREPSMSARSLIEAAHLTAAPQPFDWFNDLRLYSPSHGETLFWRVDTGCTPGAYPIYIENGDGTKWERFDMSTTDFILGILRGDVTCRFFSDLFMHTDQVFRPYAQ